jgi:phosphoglycerate dehydrogenase-like enzyme
MRLLVLCGADRTDKYLPDLPVVDQVERVVVLRGVSDEDILARVPDADFIMADAISPVSAALIAGLPSLKLIHSEGVGYDLIDLDAARARGVVVCNNRGVNADAVAEQTILLMLSCLRNVVEADAALRTNRQGEVKGRMMREGIRELGDCRIGFIGFGDIAQATALRLKPWGCEMVYEKRTPLSLEEESRFGVRFESLETLVSHCDIISIHVPATDETRGMIDAAFIARMKPDAFLINTARGEIIDQEALAEALTEGRIAGAGLDVLYPEPVQADHILINLPPEGARRIVFSPHVGGTTEGMFQRAHQGVWENIARVIAGETPLHIVS